jgi:hypothetical protein
MGTTATGVVGSDDFAMNANALRKARSALSRARQALTELKASQDFITLEGHWERFLDEANKVFTRLEQASKASSKAKAWWRKHVDAWKTDPLLQYLRAARHVSEHPIQETAKEHQMTAKQVIPTPEETQAAHRAAQEVGKPYALLGLIEVIPAHATILEITNRGITYPPPNSHLGKPFINITPASIGELALSYLESMMKEADELAA